MCKKMIGPKEIKLAEAKDSLVILSRITAEKTQELI